MRLEVSKGASEHTGVSEGGDQTVRKHAQAWLVRELLVRIPRMEETLANLMPTQQRRGCELWQVMEGTDVAGVRGGW